jgi:hypothetical protein
VQGQQASSRGLVADKLQQRDVDIGGAGLFETVAGGSNEWGAGSADQRWDMQMCRCASCKNIEIF